MKAIIFDLDGTLWDTSDIVVDIWNKVLGEKCPSLKMTKDIMSSMMGKNKAQFVDEFFVGISKENAESLISEIFLKEQEYLRINGANMFDGVLKALNKLKDKYMLMIVSNCQSGYLEAFLSYYKLNDVFTDYECAGSSPLPKGENIRLVMNRNNIDKAVFVGDTKSDEEASKIADIPFVYATYGFGEVESYSHKIDSFDEIIEIANIIL